MNDKAASKLHLIEKMLRESSSRSSDRNDINEENHAKRIANFENLLQSLLNEAVKSNVTGFKRERKCEELSEKVSALKPQHYYFSNLFFFVLKFTLLLFSPSDLQIVKLEQRLLALQNVNLKCCAGCQKLTAKLNVIYEKIMMLLAERREKLQELNNTK